MFRKNVWYRLCIPYVMCICGIVANLWMPGEIGKQIECIFAIQPVLLMLCMVPGAFQNAEIPVFDYSEETKTFVAYRTTDIYLACILMAFGYLKKVITWKTCLSLSIICGILAFIINIKKLSKFDKRRYLQAWLYITAIIVVIYPLGINYYPLATSLFSDGVLMYSFLLSTPFTASRIKSNTNNNCC